MKDSSSLRHLLGQASLVGAGLTREPLQLNGRALHTEAAVRQMANSDRVL